MQSDEYYMKIALSEAEEAFEKDEVPVGAVIVSDGKIIAKGHNLTQTLTDVTAHAEMICITSASNHLGAKYLNDCILYVTLEPCVMCAGAIAAAQIGTLVYGADDPKKGFSLINQPILHPKTIVRKDVLEKECGEILSSFFSLKRKNE